MSRGGPTYDHERISLNLVRLKKAGQTFEIVVDPDLAVQYKEGQQTDLREILHAEKIWADAKKGELASEEQLEELFGTTNALDLAQLILDEGEVQLTHEHREKMREKKYNKVIQIIHMNAINPQSGLIHPIERIRRSMEEAKVRLEDFKSAEDQIKDVVRKLQPILPIKFATFIAEVHMPAQYAPKCYGTLQSYGTIQEEKWLTDGSLLAKVELPAGRFGDLTEELGNATHGTVDISKHEKGA